MLVTPHVFIDTTAIDQNSHNYTSTHFKRITELVKENKIKIYLTSITVREIEVHIKEGVEKAQADIQSTLNHSDHRFLKNVQHPSINAVFNGIDTEGVTNALLEQFKNWTSEVSTVIIPIEGLSVDEVFDRYFQRKPPFEEKKKTEFPDAFALAALERWCKENKAKMYVISSDRGMCAACETSNLLRSVKSVPEFLSELTIGEKYTEYANKLFEANKDLILNQLEPELAMHSYWPLDYNHPEQVIYSNKTVSFPEKYLIEVDDKKAIFDVFVKINRSAMVRRYIPNLLLRNMGIMVSPHEEMVSRNKFLNAEVSFFFDPSDERKFQIEYARVRNEAVTYPAAYTDVPDYMSGVTDDSHIWS